MNCPESTYVYRHALRSYRDLPLRVAEMGRLHRNERSGTLTGLFRVRQITMDDAHIYCRPDQVQGEIRDVLELVREFYKTFNLTPSFKLATRPPDISRHAASSGTSPSRRCTTRSSAERRCPTS